MRPVGWDKMDKTDIRTRWTVHRRVAEIWFIWFVSFVWVGHEINEINETNQINRPSPFPSHSDGPGRPEKVECPRSFIPLHPASRTAAMSAPVNVRSLSVMVVPSPLHAVLLCRTPF